MCCIRMPSGSAQSIGLARAGHVKFALILKTINGGLKTFSALTRTQPFARSWVVRMLGKTNQMQSLQDSKNKLWSYVGSPLQQVLQTEAWSLGDLRINIHALNVDSI